MEVTGRTHTFDAGDLSCGDGLPKEFRREIHSIPVGDLLEVVVRDPAAKADLPSLARMMSHEIVAIDDRDDGSMAIVVRRRK